MRRVIGFICSGKRPQSATPEQISSAPPGYIELMNICLSMEPGDRPTTDAVHDRLMAMQTSLSQPIRTLPVPAAKPVEVSALPTQ